MKNRWFFFTCVAVSIFLFPQEGVTDLARPTEHLPPTIPWMTAQDQETPETLKGMGVQDLPRADGGRDKVHYSIVTPEEEAKKEKEEKEKVDRSWDMLNHIIIDRRTR